MRLRGDAAGQNPQMGTGTERIFERAVPTAIPAAALRQLARIHGADATS
jgi:hypothetical protein